MLKSYGPHDAIYQCPRCVAYNTADVIAACTVKLREDDGRVQELSPCAIQWSIRSVATCSKCGHEDMLIRFVAAYLDEDLAWCPKCDSRMWIHAAYHPEAPAFAVIFCPSGCYEELSLTAWIVDAKAEAASYDRYREEAWGTEQNPT